MTKKRCSGIWLLVWCDRDDSVLNGFSDETNVLSFWWCPSFTTRAYSEAHLLKVRARGESLATTFLQHRTLLCSPLTAALLSLMHSIASIGEACHSRLCTCFMSHSLILKDILGNSVSILTVCNPKLVSIDSTDVDWKSILSMIIWHVQCVKQTRPAKTSHLAIKISLVPFLLEFVLFISGFSNAILHLGSEIGTISVFTWIGWGLTNHIPSLMFSVLKNWKDNDSIINSSLMSDKWHLANITWIYMVLTSVTIQCAPDISRSLFCK